MLFTALYVTKRFDKLDNFAGKELKTRILNKKMLVVYFVLKKA
jgi:hypothetical protein